MDKDIKFILNVIDEEFENPETLEIKDTNFYPILKKALNNRFLHCFVDFSLTKLNLSPYEKKILNQIHIEGLKWINKFQNSLNFLKEHLGTENFVVIKTFKFYQDITFDIDIVLINNGKKQVNNLFDKSKFDLVKIDGGYELHTKTNEFLSIDIYENFNSMSKKLIDLDFIESKRLFNSKYGKYYIPSVECELLLYISQIIFQNRFITLHDFIQITKIISNNNNNNNNNNIKWNEIYKQAEKYGWKENLLDLLKIINNIYYDLYQENLNILGITPKKIRYDFPYFISQFKVIKYDYNFFGKEYIKERYFVNDLIFFVYVFLSYRIRKRLPIYRDWIDIYSLKNP